MPSISEQTTIASPLEEVWPLLSDPALVASCIPGATLTPDQGDGVWRGSVRVKFGPTVAIFRGEATLAYDHAAHRCTIEGRGIDQRGASRALASGVVTASGTDTTALDIDGNFSVTGPLETFANAGGVHVARALLAEFSGNMARVIAERRNQEIVAERGNEKLSTEQHGRLAAQSGSDAQQVAANGASTKPTPTWIAAGELSAARLIWRAFLSWLNDLFRKRT